MRGISNHCLIICIILMNCQESSGLNGHSDVCKSYNNYSHDDVVALILARGGSKGIHLKNLAKIGSDTLLGRAIKTIQKSQMFSDVWVSTDHERIIEAAEKHHVNVHIRPTNVADDDTTSIASVQEFLKFHPEVPNIALVQCTSIFLKRQYLDDAVRLFRDLSLDCVFSVVRSFNLRWKYDKILGNLTPLNFDPEHRPRRQDWDGELIETGMFYLATSSLLQNGVFQTQRCGFIEIDPDDILEIDSPSQLQLANVLVEMRQKLNRK